MLPINGLILVVAVNWTVALSTAAFFSTIGHRVPWPAANAVSYVYATIELTAVLAIGTSYRHWHCSLIKWVLHHLAGNHWLRHWLGHRCYLLHIHLIIVEQSWLAMDCSLSRLWSDGNTLGNVFLSILGFRCHFDFVQL